ncbi:hypothetical protein, partial [Gordonia jinhuaensis]|uniref:hypothetical protein n=1 Tax=Gordonia jinhuaensis TaxID=1517702 RepID=UPI001E3F558D
RLERPQTPLRMDKNRRRNPEESSTQNVLTKRDTSAIISRAAAVSGIVEFGCETNDCAGACKSPDSELSDTGGC